jgi:hypothetical protein
VPPSGIKLVSDGTEGQAMSIGGFSRARLAGMHDVMAGYVGRGGGCILNHIPIYQERRIILLQSRECLSTKPLAQSNRLHDALAGILRAAASGYFKRYSLSIHIPHADNFPLLNSCRRKG